MSAPQIDVFAQPADRAEVRWAGTDRDIPILYVGGVLVHLSQLGTDLRPWLLALSERLAEFAAGVGDDGSKVEPPCDITLDGWCATHSTGRGPVYCKAAS